MKTESIITSIEKAFRYLVPGFLFVFLFKAAFPSKPEFILPNVGPVEFAILIPCVGMMVYGVHRVLFWTVLDYLFAKAGIFVCSTRGRRYSDTLADFISWRRNASKNLLEYLHYRWSILHYTLILSEFLVVFSFLHEKTSVLHRYRVPLLIATIGLWLLSFIHYWTMLIAEDRIRSDQKSSQQPPAGDILKAAPEE